MPNVTPDPYNDIIPPSAGKPYAGNTMHEAAQAAQGAMCGTLVVGKLERFNKSLDGVEKMAEDFRVLLDELDRKLGAAPPSLPTANAVTCGGAGEKSVPSLESSVCRLTSLEERVSRNISRLRSLLNSL